ncbi:hypothetical protein SEA_FLORAL_39 [Gordonia phage Floral]|nr:hypothetical protein SEA_POLLUX_41 [Gordonia phage Pollux]QZD97172.1 hypothetical protein SEA_FLORAL_39 [Gordonia phage Floral]
MSKKMSLAEGREAMVRVLQEIQGLKAVRASRIECEALRPLPDSVEEAALVTDVKVSFHASPPYLATFVLYRVCATWGEADEFTDVAEEDQAWRITLEFCADWEVSADAELASEDLRCFAVSQGVMTCHPYARETIQSASVRMGYPPATLDIIRNPLIGDGEIEFED